jgi:hypothetical protein
MGEAPIVIDCVGQQDNLQPHLIAPKLAEQVREKLNIVQVGAGEKVELIRFRLNLPVSPEEIGTDPGIVATLMDEQWSQAWTLAGYLATEVAETKGNMTIAFADQDYYLDESATFGLRFQFEDGEQYTDLVVTLETFA